MAVSNRHGDSMNASAPFLNPAAAAKRLGVSPKALRLYEQRGLVSPTRSEAGWRAYGPEHMARAAEIVALRALGLSLAQVSRVLAGDVAELEPALAAHQSSLEAQARDLGGTIAKVRELRAGLAQGRAPSISELMQLVTPASEAFIGFDLPWPWGGERFELTGPCAITYIVGPLGSGKTRLAKCLAAELPGAVFLGLDRAEAAAVTGELQSRVDAATNWLIEDGATPSETLGKLLATLESDAAFVIVDLVEHGLDQATQEALIAHLRRRGPSAKPLFLMTRSSAILDLAEVGPSEAIILCPANHSPPSLVLPVPGAPGYEAVATCLATPEVRARTEGVVAMRPRVAGPQR
jgi:DNA-binding transcriptional MerR regulator